MRRPRRVKRVPSDRSKKKWKKKKKRTTKQPQSRARGKAMQKYTCLLIISVCTKEKNEIGKLYYVEPIVKETQNHARETSGSSSNSAEPTSGESRSTIGPVWLALASGSAVPVPLGQAAGASSLRGKASRIISQPSSPPCSRLAGSGSSWLRLTTLKCASSACDLTCQNDIIPHLLEAFDVAIHPCIVVDEEGLPQLATQAINDRSFRRSLIITSCVATIVGTPSTILMPSLPLSSPDRLRSERPTTSPLDPSG